MSGQEPEDVALAIHDFFTPDHERDDLGRDVAREFIVPLLTRLVRAGQRRELEALDREVIKLECDPATRMEVVAYGVRAGTMFVRRISEAVHARLALLREE